MERGAGYTYTEQARRRTCCLSSSGKTGTADGMQESAREEAVATAGARERSQLCKAREGPGAEDRACMVKSQGKRKASAPCGCASGACHRDVATPHRPRRQMHHPRPVVKGRRSAGADSVHERCGSSTPATSTSVPARVRRAGAHCEARSDLLGLAQLVDERLVDVGDDTTAGNRRLRHAARHAERASHKLVHSASTRPTAPCAPHWPRGVVLRRLSPSSCAP